VVEVIWARYQEPARLVYRLRHLRRTRSQALMSTFDLDWPANSPSVADVLYLGLVGSSLGQGLRGPGLGFDADVRAGARLWSGCRC
jgi:hypothetical protein